ncbi:MAG TPA: phage major capsid protein [Deinococcales bacterium]|nr:phage major capsid protein [Deinococcales bacterium]
MTDLLNELDATLTGKLEPTARRLETLEARLGDLEDAARLAASPSAPATAERSFDGRVLDVTRARAFLTDAGARAADTATLASGGLLSPGQARRFITLVTASQPTLARVQTRVMSAPQALLETLNVAGRHLRAASENTAPTPAGSLSTAKRALTTVEAILAEDVTLSFLEDNLEGPEAEFTIARLLAAQVGNDLNDLAWNGDTTAATGPDAAFLGINDGFLKLAADAPARALDGSALTNPQDLLRAMLAALPAQYKARPDLSFFVPTGLAEAYLNALAARPDGLGASALTGGWNGARFMGVPLIPDPALDAAAQAVLTPAANLVLGLQRDLRLDSQYVPRRRAVEYTITTRFDYQIVTPDALVRAHDLPAAY